MLKIIQKKDHYETELFLEFKNCKINFDEDWVFIKIDENINNRFSEIKKNIIKIIKRNPELYCDCKKIIYLKETFEEVIKVKRNNIELKEQTENCDINILLYGIWFSKNSYGPMLKIIQVDYVKNVTTFLHDDAESDEEIQSDIKKFCSI